MSHRINCQRNVLPVFLLLGFLVLYSLSNALRCFTCGPRENGFERTCEEFQKNPSTFENYCPENYNSCSIYYKEANTTRQCEQLARINDCKIANTVKYCYCSWDLCNGDEINTSPIYTDDEDILSDTGSGFSAPENNANDRHLEINDQKNSEELGIDKGVIHDDNHISVSGAGKSNVLTRITGKILLLISVLTAHFW